MNRVNQPLQVRISGRTDVIPVRTFLKIIEDTLAVIGDIDQQIADAPKPTISWGISRISKNSPLQCELVPSRHTEKDFSLEVVHDFLEGLRTLQESGRRPQHFADKSLRRFQKLPLLLADGVSEIELSSPGEGEVKLNLRLTANIEELLANEPGFYYETTTLIGTLIGIRWEKDEKEPKFWIDDASTGDQTRCIFKHEEMERASVALSKRCRVQVVGKLRHRKDGEIVRMEVERWETLPNQEDLPQAEDFHGMDLTCGEDAPQAIRRSRDAD
jgi:hypothetical protein